MALVLPIIYRLQESQYWFNYWAAETGRDFKVSWSGAKYVAEKHPANKHRRIENVLYMRIRDVSPDYGVDCKSVD